MELQYQQYQAAYIRGQHGVNIPTARNEGFKSMRIRDNNYRKENEQAPRDQMANNSRKTKQMKEKPEVFRNPHKQNGNVEEERRRNSKEV